MSWVIVAVGTIAVGTAAYSSDSQRKNLHQQQDAISAAQDEDARKTAEAATNSQVAANAQLADSKRRRRSSSLLASGDPSTDTLGGAPTALAAGGVSPSSRVSSQSYSGTALGAGASATSSVGRSYRPTTPDRASAL